MNRKHFFILFQCILQLNRIKKIFIFEKLFEEYTFFFKQYFSFDLLHVIKILLSYNLPGMVMAEMSLGI